MQTPDPLSTAHKLADAFKNVLGSDLRSVVLFGSVARGESIPGVSDVNVMILADSISASQLAAASQSAQEWVRSGNTPPYLFSWDEWSGMGDTFAIEIADMRDAREVIHGLDPLRDKTMEVAHLRLHAEQEIRETLLQLRLRLLLAAGNDRDVGKLLMSGVPSCSAYMRTVLRLNGETPPLDSREVVERAATLVDVDPDAMLAVLEARRSRTSLPLAITDPPVERYMGFLRRLLAFVDTLPVHDRPRVEAG